MFTPYSAAEPMMSGNAHTFTRLNLSPGDLHERDRRSALLACPVPEVEPGVDLEQQLPARADELPPQLLGKVAERDRRRSGPLEPLPLPGEVLGEPRLVVAECDLDRAALLTTRWTPSWS